MGKRLPRATARVIMGVLEKAGFEKVDQLGSHQKWRHPITGRQTIVSVHAGDSRRPKTFKKILEGAGLSLEEFDALR